MFERFVRVFRIALLTSLDLISDILGLCGQPRDLVRNVANSVELAFPDLQLESLGNHLSDLVWINSATLQLFLVELDLLAVNLWDEFDFLICTCFTIWVKLTERQLRVADLADLHALLELSELADKFHSSLHFALILWSTCYERVRSRGLRDSNHFAHSVGVLVVDYSHEAALDQLWEEWLLQMLAQVLSQKLDGLDVAESQSILVFFESEWRKRASVLVFCFLLRCSFGYRRFWWRAWRTTRAATIIGAAHRLVWALPVLLWTHFLVWCSSCCLLLLLDKFVALHKNFPSLLSLVDFLLSLEFCHRIQFLLVFFVNDQIRVVAQLLLQLLLDSSDRWFCL